MIVQNSLYILDVDFLVKINVSVALKKYLFFWTIINSKNTFVRFVDLKSNKVLFVRCTSQKIILVFFILYLYKDFKSNFNYWQLKSKRKQDDGQWTCMLNKVKKWLYFLFQRQLGKIVKLWVLPAFVVFSLVIQLSATIGKCNWLPM